MRDGRRQRRVVRVQPLLELGGLVLCAERHELGLLSHPFITQLECPVDLFAPDIDAVTGQEVHVVEVCLEVLLMQLDNLTALDRVEVYVNELAALRDQVEQVVDGIQVSIHHTRQVLQRRLFDRPIQVSWVVSRVHSALLALTYRYDLARS